jgi:hypothetical protein
MRRGIESAIVRRRLRFGGRFLHFAPWKDTAWSNIGSGNKAERHYGNAFARGTVRRLKLADRTFGTKRRKRVACRSSATSDTADATSSVR